MKKKQETLTAAERKLLRKPLGRVSIVLYNDGSAIDAEIETTNLFPKNLAVKMALSFLEKTLRNTIEQRKAAEAAAEAGTK